MEKRLETIHKHLKTLKLHALLRGLEEELTKAVQEKLDLLDTLERLFALQARSVVENRIERRIRESKLPERKLLADFGHVQVQQAEDQGEDRQPQQGSIHQEEGVESCAKQVEGVVVKHVIKYAHPDHLRPQRATRRKDQRNSQNWNGQGHLLGILAAAAAFGLPPLQAHAGTFSISPLRVELSPTAQTGVLTIRNQEATAVVVQADTRLWTQADGQEQLSPTRDVLVSPAVFTIPANGSQIVRVALRRAPDGERELSYRLILTEVPQPASPDFTGLSVALRLSLPVFVAPATKAQPQLDWSATRTADGRLALAARNSGNAHARVLSFSVTPATGDR